MEFFEKSLWRDDDTQTDENFLRDRNSGTGYHMNSAQPSTNEFMTVYSWPRVCLCLFSFVVFVVCVVHKKNSLTHFIDTLWRMKVYKDLVSGEELISDGIVDTGKTWFVDLADSQEPEKDFGKLVTKSVGSKYWYDNENTERLSDEQYDDKEDKTQCVQHVDVINQYNLQQVQGLKKASTWKKIQMKYLKAVLDKLPKGPEKKKVKSFLKDYITKDAGHFGQFIAENFADFEFFATDVADALEGKCMLIACKYQDVAPYAPQLYYFTPGMKGENV